MVYWKSHVRSRLQQRDEKEQVPFFGVFTCLSDFQERLEFRIQSLEEVHSKSIEKDVGVEDGRQTRLLQLQLRENERLGEKLSQTVSDLTAVLYLKEAELQYWQSRVSHYHQEALRLAKGSNSLKSALSVYEFTVECQAKELASLQKEQESLKEALAQSQRETDQLLQRWMDKKREEAYRVNEYNSTQEKSKEELGPSPLPSTPPSLPSPAPAPCGTVWFDTSKNAKKWTSHVFLRMVKGGRQFAPTNRGGKWFAHPDAAGSEVGSRETCTSTGIMLTQAKSTVPQALQIERYPKWKSQQKSREYPYSEHDNRYAFKDSIFVFCQAGIHRKRSEDSQHRSHFRLCHEGAETNTGEDISIFKSDYMEKQVNDPTGNRRFPRNHQHKSGQAAQAQGEDYFMWFGRD